MSPSDRQISLFEDSPAVELADSAAAELAKGIPRHVRFGTCSWTFSGWSGLVYHRNYRSQKAFTSNALQEYVAYPLFRTVEIDRSYYAPLDAPVLEVYAEQLPAGFECAMKVWQEISMLAFPRHPRFGDRAGMVNPSFLDPSVFEERVIAPIEASFSEHVGPLIVSIPPSGRATTSEEFEERLKFFLTRAPIGYRYAFELRDRHLFTPRYLAILREFGAAHVINYWSDMPAIREQVEKGAITSSFVVVRLMLPPGAKYSQLKNDWAPFDQIAEAQLDMRADVVDLIALTEKARVATYVYANNKAEGCAPLTIRAIAEALR